jgi:serine/threonine protein kinase
MKMENIMIHFPNRSANWTTDLDEIDLDNEEYICKVGDFGLARKLEHQREANSFVGTPKYMAPDVFFSDKEN